MLTTYVFFFLLFCCNDNSIVLHTGHKTLLSQGQPPLSETLKLGMGMKSSHVQGQPGLVGWNLGVESVASIACQHVTCLLWRFFLSVRSNPWLPTQYPYTQDLLALGAMSAPECEPSPGSIIPLCLDRWAPSLK